MPKPVYILGVSCFYHDSAAALLKDGVVVFAAQEERYTRKKQDESLPKNAIEHALAFAGITAEDLSAVVFYEKPLLKFFDRILQTAIKVWPRGFFTFQRAMSEWMRKKMWTPQELRKALDYDGEIFFTQHHEAHAASAYFVSGFPDAAVVTVDGVGEWATTTIAKGSGTDLTMLRELHFPHSLGLLYSAVTYYLGFRVNSAEYKVMGLAPYGKPIYLETLRKLLTLKSDSSFALDMRYFTYEYGSTMTGSAFEQLLGQPRRRSESELTQFHKDVARSLQELTEEVMLKIVAEAKRLTGSEHLCLAGGVALNCVANGVILRSKLFKDIFIQPAAGDAGGALGAALMIWHREFKGARSPKLDNVYLGNDYSDAETEAAITARGLPFETLPKDRIAQTAAELLAADHVIGWFQGRMEYGPRSLGSRSILGDARNKANWQRVNLKIKFRESFRPFAPAVSEEKAGEWFDLDRPSPYMLLVADVHENKRALIPAVTHVDGSARIQTVSKTQHPLFHDLLASFDELTGCPVIINTSFNVRGEPIVESPDDALRTFLATDIDALVIGSFLLRKSSMPKAALENRERYLKEFALD